MKFAFAATLLLTATSGVVARGWPGGAGYFKGDAIHPKGLWDAPDARSKCKHTKSRQVGGGKRARYHVRIKDYKGDAGSICHRLWGNLRRWGLGCTPNSFQEWKPSCGMEDGDLSWRFESSARCNEGMVESTWWEVTKNEDGGILCRDFALDQYDSACAHCPSFDEPFWAGTVWDKFKNDKKNGKRDDASADDLVDDLLAAFLNLDKDDDLPTAFVNLDKDDEKEDEDVVGKDDEAQ